MTKIEVIIENMWPAMRRSATTVQEIAERLTVRIGEDITVADTSKAIAYLRKNQIDIGWTLFHVKRGVAGPNDEGRYFRILVARNGSYYFDENPEALAHVQKGTLGTLQQSVTMNLNQVGMQRVQIQHVRSRAVRAKLEERLADYERATRQMQALLATLTEEMEERKTA